MGSNKQVESQAGHYQINGVAATKLTCPYKRGLRCRRADSSADRESCWLFWQMTHAQQRIQADYWNAVERIRAIYC